MPRLFSSCHFVFSLLLYHFVFSPKLIEDIDEYDGDNPLFPWIKCVKWVHEAFPPGGECSGLLVIYEQCVRSSGTRTGTRMIFFTSKSGWKMNAKPVEKLNDAYKKFMVPQKPIVRTAASSFEVFVDEEECTDSEGVEKRKKIETISPSSSNVLPLNDGREIKKETELTLGVQHIVEDPSILVATYEGTHNHLGPTLLKGMLQEKLDQAL
ncbi:unnamed protein product [Brassica oleracea var. botrytis]